MGDRFLIRLDKKRRERWAAAAKALFLPHLTTFIKAAADEKAEKVLNKTDLDVPGRNAPRRDE